MKNPTHHRESPKIMIPTKKSAKMTVSNGYIDIKLKQFSRIHYSLTRTLPGPGIINMEEIWLLPDRIDGIKGGSAGNPGEH
jgi:hypothetical protein